VDVNIYDKNGNLVWNINNGPNQFRLSDDSFTLTLGPSGASQEGYAPEQPTDLRLQFLLPTTISAGDPFPTTDIFEQGHLNNPRRSFIEVDSVDQGQSGFLGWDLPVSAASLSVRQRACVGAAAGCGGAAGPI
jgi:hypothetical protein